MSISISDTSSTHQQLDPSNMASKIANRMMKDLDKDQDGSISKDEFVSGMTDKGMSKDEASKMFDAIDTKKTGSITKDDITNAIQSGAIKPPNGGRPAGGHGGGPEGGGGATSAKTYDPADTNQDGTVSAQEALIYSMKQAANAEKTTTDASQLGQNVDETV